jgi:hypothetical protein
MKLKWLPFNEGKVQGMCCELQRFYEKAEGLILFDAVEVLMPRDGRKKAYIIYPMVYGMWRVHSCFHELSKGLPSS